MTRATNKSCKLCHKSKPLKEFPKSSWASDGRLGFCGPCWSAKMSKASKRRTAKARPKKAGKPSPGQGGIVHAANEALRAAASAKDRFLVRADDGDSSEFTSEEKALRKAMEWRMAGFSVSVWRLCEFEMVLRIVG